MPEISKVNLETISPLLHPIIYVRGYASTEDERDETTSDPFCGFNLGSTVYRAAVDKEKKARKFFFESPLVRLMSDFKYGDVYENGLDIADEGWTGKIPYRSIIIYRYYDEGSGLLGTGKTSSIEDYAWGLGLLIAKVKALAVGPDGNSVTDFRCYLVAHSMGGLICRAFLQNIDLGKKTGLSKKSSMDLRTVRSYVDKVFTYATPHNGIEMAGINVPSWLAMNDTNNFNRERMAEYLGLEKDPEYLAQKKAKGRVDFLRNYPLDRFFCMIGTNRSDYNVAAGLSRSFAGNGSDGLVKIDNASVYGKDALGNSIASPRAYAFRSHSGFFGIVNSEEAFQNLTRFLFGDLRVDIWFDVDSVSLPGKLEDDADNIEAGYQFELLGAPRGKPWYLTRRISEEDSVAVRTHAELTAPGKKEIYLSTVFLSSWAKVDMTDTTLSYAVTFRAGVQEYLVNGMLFTSHFEGVKLFSDTIIVSLTPDEKVEWKWAQDTATGEHVFNSSEIDELQAGRSLTLPIPIPVIIKPRKAGIAGKLRFVVTNWNIA